MTLVKDATELYKDEKLRIGLDEMIYAFDSSTIELCLKLCPWAEFHHGKGAFKMHTLMDLRGSIPTFVLLTPGKVNDAKVMDKIPVEAGAFYLMDRFSFRGLTSVNFIISRQSPWLFRRRALSSNLRYGKISPDSSVTDTFDNDCWVFPIFSNSAVMNKINEILQNLRPHDVGFLRITIVNSGGEDIKEFILPIIKRSLI